MSRNFISEQTLIDRLLLDDTDAFEEIYRRYCQSLYTYGISKLQSPGDARRIVRDIFISLWEQRHALPVDFSLSLHLYTEVRKSVVKVINEKLLDTEEADHIERQVIPGFAVMQLRQASQPVVTRREHASNYHSPISRPGNYENQWWSRYTPAVNLGGLRHAFRHILNFW
jgi:hypothetical protein